jgi:TPR repeat protein
MLSLKETGIMKHLARFFLLVFAAAIFWGLAGCASSNYEKGIRLYKPDNIAAAESELRPRAEQGDAEAQFNLGSLYYQGLGVSQDYKEAVKWLLKAAEQGHIFSQATLGTVYAEGVQGVVPKEPPRALMWYIKAAAQGDMEALEFRDNLANRMTPDQIKEAQKLAKEFKPPDTKSRQDLMARAKQGDDKAQFEVGLIYYKGQGVQADYLDALNWFKKAAGQGHSSAQYNVGYMNEKGEGTPQDYVEAAKYYHLAAEQRNHEAQYKLGYMYEKGQGVLQDEEQALMWYNLAAIQGETKAKAARDRITARMTDSQMITKAQDRAREFDRKLRNIEK